MTETPEVSKSNQTKTHVLIDLSDEHAQAAFQFTSMTTEDYGNAALVHALEGIRLALLALADNVRDLKP